MGAPHFDSSQAKLHRLFPGWEPLVRQQVDVAIRQSYKAADGKRPIRVLDIGAGSVPYAEAFSAFPEGAIDLTLLDKDETARSTCGQLSAARSRVLMPSDKIGPGAQAGTGQLTWCVGDFFDFLEPFFENEESTEHWLSCVERLGGQFDVIILAATIHELYYDAVVEHRKPADFHPRLFNCIKRHLLKSDGLLVVADYAWPSFATAAHLLKIRDVQARPEVAGHGDPPWSFKTVTEILREAGKAGLRLMRSNTRGLHDMLSDNELRDLFLGALDDAETQTLRTRIGFVLTFGVSVVSIDQPSVDLDPDLYDGTIKPMPRRASNYLGLMIQQVLATQGIDLIPQLSLHFADMGDFDFAQRASPLCHLIEGFRKIADKGLRENGISDPGIFELWINLGFESAAKRFVPELPIQWLGGERRMAGVLSAGQYLPIKDPEGRPHVGRITIPFTEYLSKKGDRSIHTWFTDLHKAMHENRAVRNSDLPLARSLTVLVNDPGPRNDEGTASSLELASLWGDDYMQASTGHFLVILPSMKVGMQNGLSDELHRELRRISSSTIGGEELKPLSENYEMFLRGVFFPTSNITSDCNTEDGRFSKWWRAEQKKKKEAECEVAFPDYRCFTTILVDCDGLTAHDPDSLMLFSTQALPPRVLEAAAEDITTLCKRLSSIEASILAQREVVSSATSAERDRQHRAMVASFGHDGKRPAITIELLLRSPGDVSIPLARLVSASLVQRLEAFSSLLELKQTPSEARAILHKEAEPRNVMKWTTARAIWEEEALNLLIRILVDTSAFKKIRANVFGANVKIDAFKSEFEPLLDIVDSPKFRINSFRAAAVAETLKRFGKCEPGFHVLYEGADAHVPEDLSGRNGTNRHSLAKTSLGFLLSEMLTNTAKHQWVGLSDNLLDEGITLCLRSSLAPPCNYSFTLLTRPTDDQIAAELYGEQRTVTGLTSLRMVAQGLGAKASCREVFIRGTSMGKFPYPEVRSVEVNGVEHVWSAYSLDNVELPSGMTSIC